MLMKMAVPVSGWLRLLRSPCSPLAMPRLCYAQHLFESLLPGVSSNFLCALKFKIFLRHDFHRTEDFVCREITEQLLEILGPVPTDLVAELSRRYILLYELITGKSFDFDAVSDESAVAEAIKKYL